MRWVLQAMLQVASDGGWFWAIREGSLVGRVLDRMLIGCGPLPLEEVVAGLVRATRYALASTRGVPAGTLLAYLRLAACLQDRLRQRVADRTGRGGAVLTASDRAIVGAFTGSAAWLSTGVLV